MDFKEEFLGLSTKIKFKILRIGFFGHPEVKEYISFLILLCAEIISFSFKYSNLILNIKKIIVTILKQRNQSAGNFILFTKNGDS